MRCQKHDERSYGRMLIATAQPPFTSPRIRSAGTTTSSKNTSANSRTPLIISIGATVIPGVSMSTKNAVMPRWRDSAVPVRVSSTQRSEYCARLVHTFWPLTTHVDAVVGVAVGNRAAAQRRRGRCRCPAPRSPGTTSPRPTAGGGRPRPRAPGGAKSMSVGASTSMSENRPGSARSRAASAAPSSVRSSGEPPSPPTALGPAVAHPARVEQDRLDALHLRDLLVERSRGGVGGARARRGARRATRAARRGSRRSPARALAPPSGPPVPRISHALGERGILA